MVVMNLTTLVVNLFIELNKIENVRKIYFDKVFEFNKLLEEETNLRGYSYYGNTNSISFYELKHGYSMLFEVYEDEIGYVVKLRDNVNITDLNECFRTNISINENQKILLEILNTIDFEKIFLDKCK